MVPARKKGQPGRSWSLSAFHLPQERGPTACCPVGWDHTAARNRERKTGKCVFLVGKHSLGAGGLTRSPLAPNQRDQLGLSLLPSKEVPLSLQNTQPPSPNLTGCMTSGFSHIGKKIQSLCWNSRPKSAASAVHPASVQLGGMRLVQPYPRM